jgi:hypothetical protein
VRTFARLISDFRCGQDKVAGRAGNVRPPTNFGRDPYHARLPGKSYESCAQLALPLPDVDLERFLKNLQALWKDGEVRPTHKSKSREMNAERTWRTRKDPFELVWPQVVLWLTAAPHQTAKQIFQRLQSEASQPFAPAQLRTLQRRIKQWRKDAARKLVFADPALALSA